MTKAKDRKDAWERGSRAFFEPPPREKNAWASIFTTPTTPTLMTSEDIDHPHS